MPLTVTPLEAMRQVPVPQRMYIGRATLTPPFKKCMQFCAESPLQHLENAVFLLPLPFMAVIAHIVYTCVVDVWDPAVVFAAGTFVVFCTYHVLDHLLLLISERYQAIGDRDKRFYVLSNLIKCVLMAAFSPYCLILLRDTLVLDDWNTTRIRNMGSLYTITDFTSLLVVRRMQWTTSLHHVCVVVFNAYSMRNDYQEENICRLVMVYAVCSTFAYVVNLLLASRFLHVSERTAIVLSNTALVVYSLACGINWIWQIYYIRRLIEVKNHWTIYCYIFMIAFVVYDDLILQRWLCYNSVRTSEKIYRKYQLQSQGVQIN